MLIEFQVTNFRSFRDRQVFSMVADTLDQHTDSNTFDPELVSFPRLLRSGVVYGANAAGKTNLLRGLQYMKNFVVNSAVAPATTQHEFSPFIFSGKDRKAPSTFDVTFAHRGRRYEYGFSINAKRVLSERLIEHVHARGRELFTRTYDGRRKKYNWKYSSYLKGQRASWSEQTRRNALFLSTAAQLNSIQLMPVFEWFQKHLVVVAAGVSLNESLTWKILQEPQGKGKILPFLRQADFGISDIEVDTQQVPPGGVITGGQQVVLHQPPGATRPQIFRATFTHTWGDGGDEAKLGLDDESSGTQEFFKNAGAWLNVIANGEVILVDEIDTSLHPLLTRFLIQRFHSSKTNRKNAQLIFNTHDLSLLDQDIFRRDQVWFVEKDMNGASRLYPLTDFKPRADESLERRYIRGQYGALPIISESQ
jgi:uncharacterized protein